MTLIAEYLTVKEETVGAKKYDAWNTLYADATYKIPSSIPVTVAAQTYQSSSDKAGDKDGSLIGLKASTKIKALSLSVAYSTQDEGVVKNGLGSNADQIFTGAMFKGGKYKADTDIYKIEGTYKFNKKLALTIALNNASTDKVVTGDEKETAIKLAYQVNKDLSVQARHATFDNYSQASRSRVYLSYNF